MTGTNWAGNIVFSARSHARPTSISELQAVVAGSDRVRALGSGHSFNRIADTDGTQVTVAGLPRDIEIDTSKRRVRASAGLTYAELAPHLESAGLALPNLGSLPHISIAGACATGTHGSGNRNGNLATAVSAIEMVTAAGDLVELTRADGRFDGAVVALGCLGIVTRMTLDLVESFAVAQNVFEGLADESLDEHFDEIFASGYSVSVFTDFRTNRIWCKRLATDPPPGQRMFGATAAPEQRNPVPGMSAANSTMQLGVPGRWHERLPHFRPEFTPSSGSPRFARSPPTSCGSVRATTATRWGSISPGSTTRRPRCRSWTRSSNVLRRSGRDRTGARCSAHRRRRSRPSTSGCLRSVS